MKIQIISDSHGDKSTLKSVINIVKPDLLLHLGDGVSDLPPGTKNSIIVRGNCDGFLTDPGYVKKMPVMYTEIFELCGIKLRMSHGHREHVKSGLDELQMMAEFEKVSVCLFGHTHEPVCFKKSGVLYLNPGSIGLPRGRKPSYGILDIHENGFIQSVAIVEIIDLQKGIFRPL